VPDRKRFELLAVDLDGTLLDSQHRLPQRTRDALHGAHAAGLKIVLCTGRSYTETRPILQQIGLNLDAAVTVGGALLSDLTTGRTLDCTPIAPHIAAAAATWLLRRGYTVMWLRDASSAGFDGYLIAGPRRHPAIDAWSAATPCEMRPIARLPDDGAPPLRLTVVDDAEALRQVSAEFDRAFDGQLSHNVIGVPMYGFTVLEAFAADVNKWSGIVKLCRRWGIDPRRTVAVGDDVNDLPMVRQAGLGVAVANARPDVRAVARRIVGGNDECGVAELIDELLRQ